MRWQTAVSLAVCMMCVYPAQAEFGFEDVRAQAAARAASPYQDSSPKVPDAVMRLRPDQYAGFHFDDQKARWRSEDLPYALEFYAPGIFHKQMVLIHEINEHGVEEIPFDPAAFASPDPRLRLPLGPGYAGFRILRKIPGGLDEIATFLDATYFRMIGYGENFGSSARGIALNTGVAGPEEFRVDSY